MHSLRSITEATEKFKNFPGGGAFEQLFGPMRGGGGGWNKNFPKIQMPGGFPGGMFKLRFDWYIIFKEISRGFLPAGRGALMTKTDLTFLAFCIRLLDFAVHFCFL